MGTNYKHKEFLPLGNNLSFAEIRELYNQFLCICRHILFSLFFELVLFLHFYLSGGSAV